MTMHIQEAKMKRILLVLAAILSGIAVLASGITAASASTWNQKLGGNYCSLSSPNQYMLQHSVAAITSLPVGTTKFTAKHTRAYGWQDAYWTTGYGHSLSSGQCNSHKTPYGYRKSLPSPVRIGPAYYATLNTSVSGDFSGDVGWDVWVEPAGTGSSNMDMASGGQAHTEIVIIIGGTGTRHGNVKAAGHWWSVADQHLPPGYEGHEGGWHRVYYKLAGGHGHIKNLRLSSVIGDAVNHRGVPIHDEWYAVDAGAEFTHGTMAVDSYQLATHPIG